MINIAILGAGEIGRALEKVLTSKKEVSIDLWDVDPAKVPNQKPIGSILSKADLLFLCVPSWTVRDCIISIASSLPAQTPIISLAKGLDPLTGHTMNKVLSELLPTQPIGILSGPMIAEELMEGKIGLGILASKDRDLEKKCQDLFSHTTIKLEVSDQIDGIALAGVLKNIYSLGLGIADGLNWDNDAKGWYVSESIKEMKTIIEYLDGSGDVAWGVAGLADLIATGFSPDSRNHQMGKELLASGTCSMKSDGCTSLEPMIKMVKPILEKLPILNALKSSFLDSQDVRTTFNGILG